MDKETFRKGKSKIRAGWAEDRIVSEDENKIVVQCENGSYLIYRRIEIPPELENPIAMNMLDGKVMFQFTERLSDDTYENISMEVAGKRKAEGRVLEALKELSFRVQIGDVLTP